MTPEKSPNPTLFKAMTITVVAIVAVVLLAFWLTISRQSVAARPAVVTSYEQLVDGLKGSPAECKKVMPIDLNSTRLGTADEKVQCLTNTGTLMVSTYPNAGQRDKDLWSVAGVPVAYGPNWIVNADADRSQIRAVVAALGGTEKD